MCYRQRTKEIIQITIIKKDTMRKILSGIIMMAFFNTGCANKEVNTERPSGSKNKEERNDVMLIPFEAEEVFYDACYGDLCYNATFIKDRKIRTIATRMYEQKGVEYVDFYDEKTTLFNEEGLPVEYKQYSYDVDSSISSITTNSYKNNGQVVRKVCHQIMGFNADLYKEYTYFNDSLVEKEYNQGQLDQKKTMFLNKEGQVERKVGTKKGVIREYVYLAKSKANEENLKQLSDSLFKGDAAIPEISWIEMDDKWRPIERTENVYGKKEKNGRKTWHYGPYGIESVKEYGFFDGRLLETKIHYDNDGLIIFGTRTNGKYKYVFTYTFYD